MVDEVAELVRRRNGKGMANNERFSNTRVFQCISDCPKGTIPSSRAYIPFVTPCLLPPAIHPTYPLA